MTTTFDMDSFEPTCLNYFEDALPGAVVASYINLNSISLVAFRQHTHPLALFLKLHSALIVSNAVDCYAVDNIDCMWRFTVKYVIQSPAGNFNFDLITKTTETQPLVSLQGVFPAFN